jgi:hypothetical protein
VPGNRDATPTQACARSCNRVNSLDVPKTNVEVELLDLGHGLMFVPMANVKRSDGGHPEAKSLRLTKPTRRSPCNDMKIHTTA